MRLVPSLSLSLALSGLMGTATLLSAVNVTAAETSPGEIRLAQNDAQKKKDEEEKRKKLQLRSVPKNQQNLQLNPNFVPLRPLPPPQQTTPGIMVPGRPPGGQPSNQPQNPGIKGTPGNTVRPYPILPWFPPPYTRVPQPIQPNQPGNPDQPITPEALPEIPQEPFIPTEDQVAILCPDSQREVVREAVNQLSRDLGTLSTGSRWDAYLQLSELVKIVDGDELSSDLSALQRIAAKMSAEAQDGLTIADGDSLKQLASRVSSDQTEQLADRSTDARGTLRFKSSPSDAELLRRVHAQLLKQTVATSRPEDSGELQRLANAADQHAADIEALRRLAEHISRSSNDDPLRPLSTGDKTARDALAAIADRFSKVSGNPSYRQIGSLSSFLTVAASLPAFSRPPVEKHSRGALLAAGALQESLRQFSNGEEWANYLKLREIASLAENVDRPAADSEKQLTDILNRMRGVAGNPRTAVIADLPEFQLVLCHLNPWIVSISRPGAPPKPSGPGNLTPGGGTIGDGGVVPTLLPDLIITKIEFGSDLQSAKVFVRNQGAAASPETILHVQTVIGAEPPPKGWVDPRESILDPPKGGGNAGATAVNKFDPTKLRLIARPVVPFVPFEVRDPKTGNPISKDAILEIPGENPDDQPRKVSAGEYYEELNLLEKELNKQGITLRTVGKDEVLLQENITPAGMFENQSALLSHPVVRGHQVITPLPKQNGGRENILTAIDLEKFKIPNVYTVPPLQPWQTIQITVAAPDARLGFEGQSRFHVDPNNQVQEAREYNNLWIDYRLTFHPDIAKAIWLASARKVHTVRSWELPLGDFDYVGAKVRAYQEVLGTINNVNALGEASANVSILGRNTSLAYARATAVAPYQESGVVSLKVTVVGKDIVDISPTTGSLADTISQDAGWKTNPPIYFSIGPIPMEAEFGITGSAGFQYGISAENAKVAVNLNPFADTDVWGRGGATIIVGGAGVSGEVTLLNYQGKGELSMELLRDESNLIETRIIEVCRYSHAVDALSGTLKAYAYIYVPDFGIPPWEKKTFAWNILKWKGFHEPMAPVFDEVAPGPIYLLK